MKPRVENLNEKKLIGRRMKMSPADNKTFQLWSEFMPRRKEITNKLNAELISMQIYTDALKPDDFTQEFEKWAAVEVSDFENIPEDMETFVLPGGLYAVFDYRGSSSDARIFQYIFGVWLPESEYLPDDRPHFEVLGEKYKNDDPDSEEEIWIPVKAKKAV